MTLEFGQLNLLPGLRQALRMMTEGMTASFDVNADTGYVGLSGKPSPSTGMLEYQVQLMDIMQSSQEEASDYDDTVLAARQDFRKAKSNSKLSQSAR